MISKFNRHAGNTVALVVENNHLHLLKSTSHARTCAENDILIACVINSVLTDMVKEVQA